MLSILDLSKAFYMYCMMYSFFWVIFLQTIFEVENYNSILIFFSNLLSFSGESSNLTKINYVYNELIIVQNIFIIHGIKILTFNDD